MKEKTAIIIGAGPAGLTAAYELLDKTDIKPVIFEATSHIGGISQTVCYKGNRMDIGGHRFFSKSDRVMSFWANILPIQGAPALDDRLLGRKHDFPAQAVYRPIGAGKGKIVSSPDPEQVDKVMLIRHRLSRILFLRKFFDYPVSLNKNTIVNLGLIRIIKIGLSYIKIRLFPIRKEKSLEDFFINRFGKELYYTFFKDYTEKVWGVPCSSIPPEWGTQRVKGLSVTKTLLHAAKSRFGKQASIAQKELETSLIERFLYPKLGPGQMWEEVARIIRENGGEIHMQQKITGIRWEEGRITGVEMEDSITGEKKQMEGDYFFSSMPVRDLVQGMGAGLPKEIVRVAQGLVYRDFITVGLLMKKLKIRNQTAMRTLNDIVPDNWIYIQERDVKLGRVQIFNNWSPYMVKDRQTVFIGLEYFCNEGDELWCMEDEQFAEFALNELQKIGLADLEDLLDYKVIRMPKAYPAYFGTYGEFEKVRKFMDGFSNLFLIGRNGMHRYNNADHSMLTAMTAVENIINDRESKANIWAVNTEEEYHESK